MGEGGFCTNNLRTALRAKYTLPPARRNAPASLETPRGINALYGREYIPPIWLELKRNPRPHMYQNIDPTKDIRPDVTRNARALEQPKREVVKAK